MKRSIFFLNLRKTSDRRERTGFVCDATEAKRRVFFVWGKTHDRFIKRGGSESRERREQQGLTNFDSHIIKDEEILL